MSIEQPYTVARYEALQRVLSDSGATVVDGVELYRAQADQLGLFTLRQDSHPNERGHALLAGALIKAVQELQVLCGGLKRARSRHDACITASGCIVKTT